jgi:hypothetical protein
MFGFCDGCADAGMLEMAMTTADASAPRHAFLIVNMLAFLPTL